MEPLTKVHHRQLTWSSSDVTQRCCRLGLPVPCYSWFLVSPRAALSVSRGVEMAVMDHSAGCFPYNVRRSYKKATWKPNWFGQRQGKCLSHRTVRKRSKGRHRESDSPLQTWPSVADLHWTHPLWVPKGRALTGAGAKHSEDATRSTACASQSSSLPPAWEGEENGDSHGNRLYEFSTVPENAIRGLADGFSRLCVQTSAPKRTAMRAGI